MDRKLRTLVVLVDKNSATNTLRLIRLSQQGAHGREIA